MQPHWSDAGSAMFFTMKDGRIHMQRSYDCFEKW